MKIIAIIVLAIALVLPSACALAREPVRIDGASEASFDATFAKLVRSLKPAERRTLALGLFGALLSHECLAPGAIIRLTFSPVEPKDALAIRPCRQHLHGLSYREILEAGEPRQDQPAAALPNNSFKPNLLRKSA